MNAAIENVYSAGGYYKTAGWTVLQIADIGSRRMDSRIRAAAGEALPKAGGSVTRFAETTRELRFTFAESGGRTKLTDIAVLTG